MSRTIIRLTRWSVAIPGIALLSLTLLAWLVSLPQVFAANVFVGIGAVALPALRPVALAAQGLYQVSLVERGGNYGWDAKEAEHCYDLSPCEGFGFKDPVVEHPHIGEHLLYPTSDRLRPIDTGFVLDHPRSTEARDELWGCERRHLFLGDGLAKEWVTEVDRLVDVPQGDRAVV